MNSQMYYERPSPDGTLPEETEGIGDVLSDTSEDIDDNKQEEEKVVEVKVKLSSLTPEQQDQLKLEAAERKKFPIPPIPDVNKFDKVFILPIFCKPGKNNYMIKYKDTTEARQAHYSKSYEKQVKRYWKQKDGQEVDKPCDRRKLSKAKTELKPECFFYQCDIPRREEDIPPFAKIMASKVIERGFTKETSVFGKWRADTESSINTAFNEDRKFWKGHRFIKEEIDRTDTELILKKYYLQLKDCFIHLASNSSWPNIGNLDFADFATKAKFLDNFVNLAAIDRTFIAANLKTENSIAPSNGLKRFEFLEILVRLANIKYKESNICKTYADATEKLITECIMPHFTSEPWQEFRTKQLWTIDVNDLLEANQTNLEKIYNHYLTPNNKQLDLQSCIAMCTQDTSLDISEKDINFCFGYCQMTVLNEERQWKTYHSLSLVEFLEFVGRLAHYKFKNQDMTLTSKIEFLLDDLMQGFGMERKEVNVEVEEFSESDDDY